jgi:PAS domain-containing protein
MNTQTIRETKASRPAGRFAPSDVVRTLAVVSSLRANQPGTSRYSEFHTQPAVAKANARQLDQMIDLIPLQMFILEPESSASFENQAAREYFGPVEAISRDERMIAVTHLDDLENVVGAYKNALSSGQPFEVEARLRGKDGLYRWFLQHMYPLQDEQGRKYVATVYHPRLMRQSDPQPGER